MTEHISRLDGHFQPLAYEWQGTAMNSKMDMEYVQRHSGRSITFATPGFASLAGVDIPLDQALFLEELAPSGSCTGRWELVLLADMEARFTSVDDIPYEYGLSHEDPESTVFVYPERREALRALSRCSTDWKVLRRPISSEWQELTPPARGSES